ncbi:glutamine-trna ligase [Holotrichia oblita]|nr:glutamine-trna ligase [Holotrichia oblita]
MEYVENLTNDIKWLGLTFKQIFFASDYYERIYDCAVALIKKGLAYVDDQTADQISESRGTLTQAGKLSPWRDRSVKENLALFADMRAGKFADGEKVLRAKIDMSNPNMNMRDPVIYRIARIEHYRTGNKWCIYPMYDFAHPLSDAFENISHSICSLEFEDHRPLYNWFISNCIDIGSKGHPLAPRQFEFSRLNIERTVMSKRWLKRFVDEKIVDGWDDPRMPTISGMRRRGYIPQAILDFVMSTGVTKSNMCVPLSALEYYVRTSLDAVVTRAAVVFNPVKIVITNFKTTGTEQLEIANNPHDEVAGKHKMFFGHELYIDGDDFSLNPPPKYKRLTVGGTVRLRKAYIIKCEKVVYKSGRKTDIDCLECTYAENSKSGADVSGIKPNGVIHYVEASTAIATTVNEFFPLLKQGTDLADENLTEVSKISHPVLCESFLSTAKPGDKFQFVRSGFYACDKHSTADNLIFNKTVVYGGGYKKLTERESSECEKLGKYLAQIGAEVLTGGGRGFPYAVSRPAVLAGAKVYGRSPAINQKEHVENYNFPLDGVTDMIYMTKVYKTKAEGLLTRMQDMRPFSEIVIALGGNWGTFYELILSFWYKKTIILIEEFEGAVKAFEDVYDFFGARDINPDVHFGPTILKVKNIDEAITKIAELTKDKK